MSIISNSNVWKYILDFCCRLFHPIAVKVHPVGYFGNFVLRSSGWNNCYYDGHTR